jgi:hypothetical protein
MSTKLQPITPGQLHLLGHLLLRLEYDTAQIASTYAELDRNVALLVLAVDERGARDQSDLGHIA